MIIHNIHRVYARVSCRWDSLLEEAAVAGIANGELARGVMRGPADRSHSADTRAGHFLLAELSIGNIYTANWVPPAATCVVLHVCGQPWVSPRGGLATPPPDCI